MFRHLSLFWLLLVPLSCCAAFWLIAHVLALEYTNIVLYQIDLSSSGPSNLVRTPDLSAHAWAAAQSSPVALQAFITQGVSRLASLWHHRWAVSGATAVVLLCLLAGVLWAAQRRQARPGQWVVSAVAPPVSALLLLLAPAAAGLFSLLGPRTDYSNIPLPDDLLSAAPLGIGLTVAGLLGAVAFALAAKFSLDSIDRQRRSAGLCARCGYAPAVGAAVCSECGIPMEPLAKEGSGPRAVQRGASLGLGLIAVLGAGFCTLVSMHPGLLVRRSEEAVNFGCTVFIEPGDTVEAVFHRVTYRMRVLECDEDHFVADLWLDPKTSIPPIRIAWSGRPDSAGFHPTGPGAFMFWLPGGRVAAVATTPGRKDFSVHFGDVESIRRIPQASARP